MPSCWPVYQTPPSGAGATSCGCEPATTSNSRTTRLTEASLGDAADDGAAAVGAFDGVGRRGSDGRSARWRGRRRSAPAGNEHQRQAQQAEAAQNARVARHGPMMRREPESVERRCLVCSGRCPLRGPVWRCNLDVHEYLVESDRSASARLCDRQHPVRPDRHRTGRCTPNSWSPSSRTHRTSSGCPRASSSCSLSPIWASLAFVVVRAVPTGGGIAIALLVFTVPSIIAILYLPATILIVLNLNY